MAMKKLFMDALPYLNFAVACSALTVQTTLLHPWHAKLEAGFEEVVMHGESILNRNHANHVAHLRATQEQVRQLRKQLNAKDARARLSQPDTPAPVVVRDYMDYGQLGLD